MGLRKKLVKAFAAVAIFGAALGAVPSPMVQPAQAATTVNVAASTAAISAANAAAAARRARENREAQNDAIVNPSAEHITRLRNRGLVDDSMIPYIAETVNEMHIAPGTKPSDISEAQRSHFIQTLKDKRLVAEMSAGTGAEAMRLGMSSGLAPYFETVKAELGYDGAVTLPQAQSMEQRMKDIHWERDTTPVVIKTGAVVGTLGALGALGYAISKRNRDY